LWSPPDGVEYHRTSCLIRDRRPLASTSRSSPPRRPGSWRVAAFTDPKRPAIGEATFLVEDYVPDRLEFDLTTTATFISPRRLPKSASMAASSMARRPLASTSTARSTSPRVDRASGFAGYDFGLDDDSDAEQDDESDTFRSPIRRKTDRPARRASPSRSTRCPPSSPAVSRPEIVVRMAEAGGRAIERKLTLPSRRGPMIGSSLCSPAARSATTIREFDVVMVAPDGKPMPSGLHWQLLRVDSKYQWYPHDGLLAVRAGQGARAASPTDDLTSRPTRPAASRCR
jgi:uncharacterized protein YfaS (alpha-2-macroglobulin family)